jgi:hypothetical protein
MRQKPSVPAAKSPAAPFNAKKLNRGADSAK